jgi:hypothetical protein
MDGKFLGKARSRPLVTDHPFSFYFHFDEQRIEVAVGRGGHDLQAIPRRLAFRPELIAGATVKRHIAALSRLVPRFLVHKPKHQDVALRGVLHNRGHQALHFLKVNLHHLDPHRTLGYQPFAALKSALPLQPSG